MNNNNKNQIYLEFLNWIGISISDSSPPILILAYVFIVLAVISILCSINILIYLLINKIVEHPKILEKLSKWSILIKLLNFYKNIRLFYVIFDILLLIYCLINIIRLCIKIINTIN